MLIQAESLLMSMTNNESKKVRETPLSVSQIYGERFAPQMGRLIHFSEKVLKALEDARENGRAVGQHEGHQ